MLHNSSSAYEVRVSDDIVQLNIPYIMCYWTYVKIRLRTHGKRTGSNAAVTLQRLTPARARRVQYTANTLG